MIHDVRITFHVFCFLIVLLEVLLVLVLPLPFVPGEEPPSPVGAIYGQGGDAAVWPADAALACG